MLIIYFRFLFQYNIHFIATYCNKAINKIPYIWFLLEPHTLHKYKCHWYILYEKFPQIEYSKA